MALEQGRAENRAFAGLFILALLVRLFIPGVALDRLYNYDLIGGAAWMKIHPGSYLIFAAALLALASRKTLLGPHERRPILALLAVSGVCALSCILRGSTTALGLLVDNMLCAAAGLFCLSQLSGEQKRLALCAILAGMVLNATLILYEFFSRTVVFKPAISYSAHFFRPSGLLNHPLDNGLYLVAAIPAAMLLRRPFPVKLGLALLFLLATFASGARLASIVALPTLIAAYALAVRQAAQTSRRSQRITLLVVILAAIAAPLALVFALTSGMGYRFAGNLFDVSAQTRLNVYALVAHLDFKSLMLGAGVDQMTAYAAHLLDELVESPLVVAIFMFGLPLALLYLGVMIYALYEGARRGDMRMKILALAFVLVGAGNNVFVSKTPVLLYALMLVYGALAFCTAPQTIPRPVSDADRRRAAYAARRLVLFRRPSARFYLSPGASAFNEKA